jgi:nicotinamidase-related amidase
MPLTQLDPRTALLVVDLQQGIIGFPSVHPIGEIIGRVRVLLDAFRAHRLPVVLINVAGRAPGRTENVPRLPDPLPPGWIDLIPELDRQPGDIVVTKRTWGAFASTDLQKQLQEQGVTQVVLTGVATGTGVESTARQAYELGFNVSLALDAMTDARPEAHQYSIRHVFPRLGETGTSGDVIDLLKNRRV